MMIHKYQITKAEVEELMKKNEKSENDVKKSAKP
jgi:hypothetical protein